MSNEPIPPRPDEAPEHEAEVVARVLPFVQRRLPPGWTAAPVVDLRQGSGRADALVEVTDPAGVRARLVIEAKRSATIRDVRRMLEQLEALLPGLPAPASPMVAASYLAAPTRVWLEEQGVSYADATGNLYIMLRRPALFLRDVGADRDPWRGPGRPQGSLVGAPAAHVVRALVDFALPVSIPELIRRSGASTGATYRVVEFLEREALISRTPRGPITNLDWRRLLVRWSEDYGFLRTNQVRRYLHPRGLDQVLEGLAGAPDDVAYALTGSLAANRWAPYAPPRLAMIYTRAREELAVELGLRAVDAGANVLLATGSYDVVFDRLAVVDGLNYVAPSQAAVDLLTGPGRNPAEAGALLDWMETHEHDWRR